MERARRSFSLKEKREAMHLIDLLIMNGVSCAAVCQQFRILPRYYCRWRKTVAKVDELKEDGGYVAFNTNGSARKIHPGHPGVLVPIKEQLSEFIVNLRDQGVQCTNRMVMREASRIVPAFLAKTSAAKEQIIRHFTKHIGLTHHVATHTAQKHCKETENEMKDFIVMMKARLYGRSKDEILNMDQTPITYSFHARTTLEANGTKTIQVRASTNDTKHVTVTATVTASGKMLPPFMIFKGASHGRIATREFVTYPAGGKCACQPKAWMDEVQMHAWIDVILKPYKDEIDAQSPGGQPPVLILDSYHVHQMGSVVNRIQSMRIEVIHISVGCTYLCQPIDVGINKPLKNAKCERCEAWMVSDGIINEKAKEPSRKQVADWLVDAYTNIPQQVGQNAWLMTGYSWF